MTVVTLRCRGMTVVTVARDVYDVIAASNAQHPIHNILQRRFSGLK